MPRHCLAVPTACRRTTWLQRVHVTQPENGSHGYLTTSPPTSHIHHRRRGATDATKAARCSNTVNTCKYIHKCRECWGPHPGYHCPRSEYSHGQLSQARSPPPKRQRGPPLTSFPYGHIQRPVLSLQPRYKPYSIITYIHVEDVVGTWQCVQL